MICDADKSSILSLEQARDLILAAARPLPADMSPLAGAQGRFTSNAIRSPIPLPPADNSAMDGFAVRSQDLAAASANRPIALRILGTAPAGSPFDISLTEGTCVRLFTGSVIPPGADAVVMQEQVGQNPKDPSLALFAEPAPPGQHIRPRGRDAQQGAILLHSGERLTAARLSLLAAAGLSYVRVVRQPVATLLATGSELREPGQPLPPGALYESNRIGLATLALQAGVAPRIHPITPDNLAATKAALALAFSQSDVVISTGGISVGATDWIKPAFTEIGGQLDFWKVDMRPGRPFAFGRWHEKLFFGLPGNPVSAHVTFHLLVRPALLRLQGARDVLPLTVPATLAEPLINPTPRRHFMSVVLDAARHARPAGDQSSHILTTLSRADGLVDVPPSTTLPANTPVSVILLNP